MVFENEMALGSNNLINTKERSIRLKSIFNLIWLAWKTYYWNLTVMMMMAAMAMPKQMVSVWRSIEQLVFDWFDCIVAATMAMEMKMLLRRTQK